MATIDFLKAGEPVERYDDAAIDDYVEGQKVEIIKAADDLGMPQLYTAIAGAMAEENNSYLEHPSRDDLIDKYALSGLTVADLVGVTETSFINGWTTPTIQIISIVVEGTLLTRTHQEWVDLYNEVDDDMQVGSWEKIVNPVLIDLGKGNIQLATAIRLLQETDQGTLDILGLTDYKDHYDTLASDLVNDDKGLAAKFYGLKIVEAEKWFVGHNAYGSDWGTLPQEIKDALYITYVNIGRGQMEKRFTEATNNGRIPYDPLPAAGAAAGLNHLFNAQDIAARMGVADYGNINFTDTTSDWVQFAKEESDKGTAYREALFKLRAFVVQDGDYVEEVTNREDFSDSYLQDRADMLSWLIKLKYAGVRPDDFNTYTQQAASTSYLFEDVAGKFKIRLGTGEYTFIGFGDAAANTIIGESGSDRIYGMSGDDTLSGAGGDDYLEGGKGRDNLFGGSSNDTFFIMGEDEAYDTFTGGEGTDTILGSTGDDTIRLHDFQGENTVEIIDGGGGTDIIAGTDGADTIDLRATTLTGIARIEGGAGADIIKGGNAVDILYGGSLDNPEDTAQDRLEGGAGVDEYHIGRGDSIEDSDNQGTIWFNGQQLSNMVFKQQNENGNYYENDDNSWRGVLNGDGSLNISQGDNSSFFTIKNFASGSYGITLAGYTPQETDFTFSGTSAKSTGMVQLRQDNDGDHWYYRFFRRQADGTTTVDDRDFTLANIPSVDVTGSDGRDFLYGMHQSDTLTGGAGDDTIYGWDVRYQPGWNVQYPAYLPPATAEMGGDVLSGGAGNDYIIGAMGDDTIDGGENDDILSGKEGADFISGGQGKDVLLGGAGNDVLQGGAGDDYLAGDATATLHHIFEGETTVEEYEYIWLQPGDGTGWSIFSQMEFSYSEYGFPTGLIERIADLKYNHEDQGNDYLAGGLGNDYILGMAGDDTLFGEEDNDTLDGGAGNDYLSGGTGNDLLTGDQDINHSLDGQYHGNDILDGGTGNDILLGNGGNDTLSGGEDNDELQGGNGIDRLDGGTGDDRLYGDNGDFTGTGNDTLHGGAGNDQLVGGLGDDTLYGDEDNDILMGDNGDFTGTGNDILYGGTGNDVLQGGNGIDRLDGGDGNDILIGDNGNSTGTGDDILFGGAGDDQLAGGMGDDILFGGEDNDKLMGDNGDFTGTGNDTLYGGAGDDELVGGGGDDTLYGEEDADVLFGQEGNDNLDGGAGNDQLQGGNGNDQLNGEADEDVLFGDDGNDTLDGGEGEDKMYGGAGNDTYVVDVAPYVAGIVGSYIIMGGDAVVEEAGEGFDTVQASVDYTLGANVERLILTGNSAINATGNSFDNVLTGNSGVNTLSGGAGNDTLNGGAEADTLIGGFGNDIYVIEDSNIIAENTGEGLDTVQADFSYTLGVNLENLILTGTADIDGTGNALANVLTGNNEINTLMGGAGDDTLDGGAEADTLMGGSGDDSYVFDTADILIEKSGEGIDTIISGVSHTLGGNFENLTLTGSGLMNGTGNALNNVLTGNSADNMLIGGEGTDTLRGGAGADTLTGGLGNDTLDGGTGNDTYTFNLGDGADIINNYDTSDVDTVSFGAGIVFADINLATKIGNNLSLRIGSNGEQLTLNNWFSGTAYQVDRFSFTDGTVKTGAEILAGLPVHEDGTADNDALQGYEGVDIMTGGAGNDNLAGGAGNDTLTGGLGKDTLDGGAGNDTYIFKVGDGSDTINNYDTTGIDSVAFGVGINLADLHDFVGLNNNLVIKIGSNGDMLTMNNWFSGTAYQPARFTFADGTTVSAAELVAGRTIPMAVNQTLVGTTGDDIMVGGIANDVLAGVEGNDTLTGGRGDDTLSGGTGNDTYIFNLGDGADTINNYDATGIDTISFGAGIVLADINLATRDGYNLILGIGSNGDQLTLKTWFYSTAYQVDRFSFADGTVKTGAEILAGLPVHMNGTTWNDSLSGYAGADIITGGAGDDALYGFAGNDTLIGGIGDDTLDGGTGNDTYVFNPGDGADIINNNDSSGVDTVSFGAGIALTDVNLATRVDTNLILGIGSTGDQLTINNWFYNGTVNQIDRFAFADGTVKSGAEILAGLPVHVNGTTANDSLTGYEGADIMTGGAGNDILYGYTGNDTYIFNLGDGADTISDTDSTVGNIDTIKFGAGISASDITLSRSGYYDLILGINGTSDQVKIQNWGNETRYRIERVEFADGTVWDATQVQSQITAVPIVGTEAVDTLRAWPDENATLQGLGGNDTLYGNSGKDILEGGTGNDYLSGGGANDTYLFNFGDGQDTIYDSDSTAGNIDCIKFGAGIAASDITFSRNGSYDLILGINGTSDQLTIHEWGTGTSCRIERVEFADGTIWASGAIQAHIASILGLPIVGTDGNDTLQAWPDENNTLQGLGGNDRLISNNGSDTLEGGIGNDYLQGGTGNDTYLFNRGDGQDTIFDSDATAGNLDTLRFGAGIVASDITFTRIGDDHILGINGTDDQVKIQYWNNHLSGPKYQIEHVEFTDGTVWDVAYIQAQSTRFIGTSGSDTLVGGAGNDTLKGGVGNDSVNGDTGNDILEGGVGNDSLNGGADNDTYLFSRGDGRDTIDNYDIAVGVLDTLRFGTGIAASDITFARSGNNLILGINGTSDQVTIQNWGAGTPYRVERIEFTSGPVWDAAAIQSQIDVLAPIVGTSGADSLFAWIDENATLQGLGGNDYLYGKNGNDTYLFDHGDGQDAIFDSGTLVSNLDTIRFGAGIAASDITFARSGNNLILGINGTNDQLTLRYWSSGTSYRIERIEFTGGTVWDAAYIQSQIALLAPITGTDGGDSLIAWAGENDILQGGAGDDVLNAYFSDSNPTNNALLDGGAGDDHITTSSGGNLIIGGTGSDQISVEKVSSVVLFNRGDGQDTCNIDIYKHTLSLGGGIAYADLRLSIEDYHLVLETGANDRVTLDMYYNSCNIKILQIITEAMSGYNPESTNNLYNKRVQQFDFVRLVEQFLEANAADPMITSWDLQSHLAGASLGGSNKLALGGAMAYEYGKNGSLAQLTEAEMQSQLNDAQFGVTGQVIAIPNTIIGGDGNDTLVGGLGDDTINGGAGADALIGGLGDDTYVVDNIGDVVTENTGEGSDTIESSITCTLLPTNVENLTLIGSAAINGTGNDLDNILLGNGADNTLSGGVGNDRLSGGLGVDTLIGGLGNDIYMVDSTSDIIVENTGEGNDTVEAICTYSLGAGIENLTLMGTSTINGLGNELNNILTGNTAQNTLSGGLGNDTYRIDSSDDIIIENLGEGSDTVEAAFTYSLGAGVENLTLTGTAAINGSGNELDNILTGNTGNNSLFGEAGNDRLIGGSGSDTLQGGLGNDTYVVDSIDTIVENTDEGIDTVEAGFTYTLGANVENLTLTGSSAINGTGNGSDNILIGNGRINTLTGGDGNDTLSGMAGNDVLRGNAGNDYLDGGIGNDNMAGGVGDDSYVVNGTDVVTENLSEGTDTVLTGITYTLGSNVEKLILTGASAINGTGNSLANVLTGNSGANILTGGSGSDQMLGGLGNDTYVVDNVGDIVTENAGEGTDTVQAGITFVLADNIENLTLTGTSAINGTGNTLANVLTGNTGANTLTGGEGNDTLNGGAGNDILDGGLGNDRMVGGLGNDSYVVDISADIITENLDEGTDTVQAGIAYTLGANVESLLLTGTAAINGTGNTLANVLTGNSGANTLTGGDGNDTLNGGAGDDILVGGLGDDKMLGGLGNDTYVVDVLTDTITEVLNEGTDRVQSGISYTLGSNVENLTLTGTSAINGTGNSLDNVLTGNSGANTLTGGTGIDTLNGGAGDDILDGGTGADTLLGGAGNDTYIVDNIGDIVTESAGAGTDRVQSGISYTLGANVENLTLTGTSAINGTGNTLANVLTGNSGANILDGGTGIDTLLGGAGNDTYIVDNTGDIVTEVLAEGTDTVQSGITYTLGANVENLTLTGTTAINGTGNTLDNILWGNSGANTLTGGDGNDTLNGGDGNDILVGGVGNDKMLGGLGNDTYAVDVSTDTITEVLNEGTDTVQSGIAYTLGSNVENLTLTGTSAINGTGNILDNVLTGNSGVNTLAGGAGNDTLNSGAGDDILDGGTDIDTLLGGAGNDTYIVDNAGDIVTEILNEGTDTVQSGITYTLGANVENLTLTGATAINGTGNELANVLTGNSGVNTLTGGAGNDTLNGGAGADILVGGLGNDIYLVDNSADIITEILNEGTDSVQSSITYTLSANVENLTLTGTTAINGTGNELANVLTGNSGVNTLTGGAGNDTLNGGTGADILVGGLGNDIYLVDNSADIITEILNEGTDTAQSSITYTLAANVENLTLTGTTAINGTGNELANVLTGNSGANTLTGGAGNDTLNGGVGADIMFGGVGNDIYVVDDSADVITEILNEGTDTVQANFTYTLGANVENLTLTGTTAINGTGNELANVLTGNSGVNTLTGGAGNDTLNGGTGADMMFGGADNDIYVVDDSADSITENAGDGTDAVQTSITYTLGANVENLTLTGATAINATGNTLDNVLLGNTGANILTGGAGNDTLNGGVGADTMLGGIGDDVYVVDDSADSITENTGEGTDTVQVGITYTLAANVENLTLTGTTAINATGNTLDNVIIGNSGVNTLTGGAGNDTLNGGAGADTMLGGIGDDIYVVDNAADVITENTSEGTDMVQAGITYTLGVNVENLTLTGTTVINGTGNELANVLTGNSGVNTLVGGIGNDILTGGLGNDTLTGGADNDFFVFDTALNATTNRDSISDFATGLDKIQLDKSIFTSLVDEGTLSSAFFNSSSTGVAGDANDYFLYNTTSGALLYDADGNGQGVAVQFATLTTKPAITANDFLVTA